MANAIDRAVRWIRFLFVPVMMLLAVAAACGVLALAALWAANGFPLEVGAPEPSELTGIAAMMADRVNRGPLVRAPADETCECACPVEEPAVGGLKSAPSEFQVERAIEDVRPNKADRKE